MAFSIAREAHSRFSRAIAAEIIMLLTPHTLCAADLTRRNRLATSSGLARFKSEKETLMLVVLILWLIGSSAIAVFRLSAASTTPSKERRYIHDFMVNSYNI